MHGTTNSWHIGGFLQLDKGSQQTKVHVPAGMLDASSATVYGPCNSGAFITRIFGRAGGWIDSITSFMCSDGETVPVNVGVSMDGLPVQAFSALGFDGARVSVVNDCGHPTAFELFLAPFTSGIVFGSCPISAASLVSATCDAGAKITGLRASSTPPSPFVDVIDVICGALSACCLPPSCLQRLLPSCNSYLGGELQSPAAPTALRYEGTVSYSSFLINK